MEERTESRPAQESTFWEQIKEQQPPTVETEAQIHFDEGASVSFETRTDRSHVDIVQTELQENPQEQPVDIPPGPSGIQHSTSLSQVIEAAVHPQPSTPTNEHSTSLSQEIEAAVQPQPSTPTNEHSTSLSQEIEAAVQPQPSTPTNEHSTSLSQEIEAAVHPQPATPTNEAKDVMSQNLDCVRNSIFWFKSDYVLNVGLVMFIQPTMLAAYLLFCTSRNVVYLIESSFCGPTFQFNPWEICASMVVACLSAMFVLPFIFIFGLMKGGHKTPFTEHFYSSFFVALARCWLGASAYTEENRDNETIGTV